MIMVGTTLGSLVVAEDRDLPKKKTNIIGNIIRFFFYLLVWTVIALFINILIEILGILFAWWELPGSAHSLQMLRVELGWLNRDFHGVLGSPTDNAVRFSSYMYNLFFVWFGYDIALSIVDSSANTGYVGYIKASLNITQLFFVRVIVLTFSLPIFLLFAAMALVDGLMKRELRRFGGDRESGWIWHRAFQSIKPLSIAPFVLYLASPWSIHPTIVILPFVLMISYAIWLSTLKFKKYA